MNCSKCRKPIPKERLEIFPHTQECVNCSSVVAQVAFMDYPHKTGGSIVVIDGKNTEGIRQAKRAYRRSR